MTNIEIDYILCHATAGANIYACAKDAALMALTENRYVRFVHNNKTYDACPKALAGIVLATGTLSKSHAENE